ncbi:GPW/gp25 family protein [Pantoea eucrina]|uniref:GPW/gp25 family protein n=1 Tax=Pantoea eucrina TaxID=472693 RepID=A0ABU5LE14_9GAMM|nr:GPW/gp25 family protein [Pantoea eucrina]MDZ7278193.1 GPW/gp25 family protein [Pantoea eucrina]
MTTAIYTGMNRESGGAFDGLDHIRQTIRDILTTPLDSGVMRRLYGSLLSALIDQPQSEALLLQNISAYYMATQQWDPRLTLTAINFASDFNGAMLVELTGNRTDSAQPRSFWRCSAYLGTQTYA